MNANANDGDRGYVLRYARGHFKGESFPAGTPVTVSERPDGYLDITLPDGFTFVGVSDDVDTATTGYDIYHDACQSWHTIPGHGVVTCAVNGDRFQIGADGADDDWPGLLRDTPGAGVAS